MQINNNAKDANKLLSHL